MQLIPKHTISYKGVFRRTGAAFDIDPQDEAALRKYGEIIPDAELPKRGPGRPKKEA